MTKTTASAANPSGSQVPASTNRPSGWPRRWNWKPKLRWFAAEIAVVVVGVLIALALNAWWQARQAAAGEESYLTLISRDLGQMMGELDELRTFEENQVQGGFSAYQAISSEDRSARNMAIISEVMSRLTLRRTMRLTNPAYQDLLSTGNLQLIRNRELRDGIVSFYEKTEREFEIHNANNLSYVDMMYKEYILGNGLFFFRGATDTTIEATTEADSIFSAEAEGGFLEERDPIWRYSYASPEWIMVKGQLLARIRISVYGRLRAESLLEETRDVRDAVDAELARL